MNKGRRANKFRLCREHRQMWYERSLDRLISGDAKPEDVSQRWKKFKEVK